jgi:hypothetical protein
MWVFPFDKKPAHLPALAGPFRALMQGWFQKVVHIPNAVHMKFWPIGP